MALDPPATNSARINFNVLGKASCAQGCLGGGNGCGCTVLCGRPNSKNPVQLNKSKH